MRFRRTFSYHNLKKGRVRATWNKYNLYNLSRLDKNIPQFIAKTFFQQKWAAKALSRAYHGEHIREGKWERMFSRRLRSVVDMGPAYMARNDGSEQATGRGSGLDTPVAVDKMPWQNGNKKRTHLVKGRILERESDMLDSKPIGQKQASNAISEAGPTPYMHMTFAPLERRIDIAIHRALFASSSRQARQFVIHGAVKVNGQVMTHPSYLLNPGDMFQVDPDMVMYATGRKKFTKTEQQTGKPRGTDEEAAAEEEEETEEAAEGSEEAETEPAPQADPEQVTKQLKVLSRMAKEILHSTKGDLTVKKKQKIRSFVKEAREISSKLGRKDGKDKVISKDLVLTINDMLKDLVIKNPSVADRAQASGAFSAAETAQAVAAADAANSAPSTSPAVEPVSYQLGTDQSRRLKEVVDKYDENPIDDSKPYRTPWQPRRYMSPFAFIPQYLEVNQNICAAVYLRHPVARAGQSEVPSPFPPSVMQLAFNWYLRRR
ncbi:hypothetical protein BD289DRAFT_430582 [Coniella lustricola]|uniref:RNA-binding S4 domain-containing protein n=1 Tax=Coniella lustricola TaxID=2025994 RepID=A0A2T3ABX6_9PEZI|nr:hypothetical protein BD289DRAFT_430582 [Coniella lustricola]